jgi:uncharacterized membrane protein
MTLAETDLSRSDRMSARPQREAADLRDQTFHPHINVGSTERMVTGGLGGLLAIWGLNRLTHLNVLSGLVGAGVGALLLKRAATGHCDLYAKLGIQNAYNSAAGLPTVNVSDT